MSNASFFAFSAAYPEAEYVVIFTSVARQKDEQYHKMNRLLEEQVTQMRGFVGMQSLQEGEQGITLSYWDSLEAIDAWRHHHDHVAAKSQNKKWYTFWTIYICKVEKMNDHGQ